MQMKAIRNINRLNTSQPCQTYWQKLQVLTCLSINIFKTINFIKTNVHLLKKFIQTNNNYLLYIKIYINIQPI